MCSTCLREIEEEDMADMVEHPAHYGGKDDPYEVIKVAEAWGFDKNAYLFNILKYIRRDKGATLEDLKKAKFYLDRLITRLEGEAHREEAEAAWPDVQEMPLFTRPVKVYLNDDEDPFSEYILNAHMDWTVETFAAIVATVSGTWSYGTFGLSLTRDGGLFNGKETMGWLLRNWPDCNYYLRKTGF